ncbi:MAG TPA: CGP-CTERM sorting domain-containing protein [Candidatus Merdivicinus excrementipullorum]|uniref:CGP-CTERM sorting domain-containing protein n=1 Tax=Candidatus Merdivicinus excrementipullorum TaxID=2840867 RepID=A0A9D1JYV5_9FIRM|nr:CGP-CTERM sorting domain-containing protein [Candidatus Merdivicinus excrementipullorum]
MILLCKIKSRGHPRRVCGPAFFLAFAAGPRKD